MEKEIKVLIVDDEIAPRRNLKQIIKNYSKGFSVIGEAEDVLSGLRKVVNLNPDLIILDIEMPGGNGFELLEYINGKKMEVIFSTAHHNYAIKAFRYNALDYILKPVDIDVLLTALEKAKEKICHDTMTRHDYSGLFSQFSNRTPLKLAIHSQSETEFIEINSIVRLEASGCYTQIFLENGRKITVSRALGEYECLLIDENFTRVHHSHVINMRHVMKFVKKDGLMARMTDNYPVPIAVRRKEIFEEKLKSVAI